MTGYNDRNAIAYGWLAQAWFTAKLQQAGFQTWTPDDDDPFAPIDVFLPGFRPLSLAVKGTLVRRYRLARRPTEQDHWCDLYVLVTPTTDHGSDCRIKGWTWGRVFAESGFWEDNVMPVPAWVLADSHLETRDFFAFLERMADGHEAIPARTELPYPPTPYAAAPRPEPVIPPVARAHSTEAEPGSDRGAAVAPPAAAPRLTLGVDRDPLLAGDPVAKVEVRRAGWRASTHRYQLRKKVDQETVWDG